MILMHQLNKSNPRVSLLHQELLQHRGGEPHRSRIACPGWWSCIPPSRTGQPPPGHSGTVTRDALPGSPHRPDGLWYSRAAAAAPAMGRGDRMGQRHP